jgi:hypothetical protein
VVVFWPNSSTEAGREHYLCSTTDFEEYVLVSNYSNSIRGQSPENAWPYLKRIYRSLLSRAMQSCRVYCIDTETREYFESRIQVTTN